MFFKPIHILRALNTGTCIQQGDLFYSAGQHRKILGEVLEKMQMNGLEGRNKEEDLGSKHSMYGYILIYSML